MWPHFEKQKWYMTMVSLCFLTVAIWNENQIIVLSNYFIIPVLNYRFFFYSLFFLYSHSKVSTIFHFSIEISTASLAWPAVCSATLVNCKFLHLIPCGRRTHQMGQSLRSQCDAYLQFMTLNSCATKRGKLGRPTGCCQPTERERERVRENGKRGKLSIIARNQSQNIAYFSRVSFPSSSPSSSPSPSNPLLLSQLF